MTGILLLGVGLLLAAVALVAVAVRRETASERHPRPADVVLSPLSTDVVFHDTRVHVMVGGRSYGMLTRLSLPGDSPEVWEVAVGDETGRFDTRDEAERFAHPRAVVAARRYEAQTVAESAHDSADLALSGL